MAAAEAVSAAFRPWSPTTVGPPARVQGSRRDVRPRAIAIGIDRLLSEEGARIGGPVW
jgi:hypothetical protein